MAQQVTWVTNQIGPDRKNTAPDVLRAQGARQCLSAIDGDLEQVHPVVLLIDESRGPSEVAGGCKIVDPTILNRQSTQSERENGHEDCNSTHHPPSASNN